MLLGIDLGTTTLKAAVLDGGRVRGAVAVPLATRRAPGGLAEQESEAWLAALSDALAALAPHLPGVEAVGVTSQVNTHVPVGRDGRALAPAILWADTRAGADARPGGPTPSGAGVPTGMRGRRCPRRGPCRPGPRPGARPGVRGDRPGGAPGCSAGR